MSGCQMMHSVHTKKYLEKSEFFNGHFTGFVLFDPQIEEYLYEWNADKYFNPASNVKLLSYFAGLKLLGDSIPGLTYQMLNDTVYFMGTGDPTFLHFAFEGQKAYRWMERQEKPMVYVPRGFLDKEKADGWTWEDYQYYYQPERSVFPLYGNEVSILLSDSVALNYTVIPKFFSSFTELVTHPVTYQRHPYYNIFSYRPSAQRSQYKSRVPFITSDELAAKLLGDTLDREIILRDTVLAGEFQTQYSVSASEYYAYMLKMSDNLLAEQLSYLICHEQNWPMSSAIVRDHVLFSYFDGMSHKPIWKDGSGLSRYNLATPRSMAELIGMIVDEVGVDELKRVLPAGGVDGTIEKWYKPKTGEQPYVFAKTGTLSNNHNLTGLLETRSGRMLYFSFMNNHFDSGSSIVKQEMEKVLRMIYEKY